jgi:MFS superfamily sulfate permease-like transporter
MTDKITHKTIITNTNTNEVTVIRHDFSDYKTRSPRWDDYARAVLNLFVDALKSEHTEVEIVTVSEEDDYARDVLHLFADALKS